MAAAMRTTTTRPRRFRGRTIFPRPSVGGRFTTRRTAASSARSESAWNIGQSSGKSGEVNRRTSQPAGRIRFAESRMTRGGRGPRQPGGGRQTAGPRDHHRGASFAKRRAMSAFGQPQRVRQEQRPPRGSANQQAQASAKPAGHDQSASTGVQTTTVTPDESGMRVDRFLEARFPGLSFSHIQRVIRKGELRVEGRRVEPKDRLASGQAVGIPPLRLEPPKPRGDKAADADTREFLRSITLYEDADVLVLNKPMGLAVQGGSGTVRHLDGMLETLRDDKGQRPRLVHRLDKDTAGCLLVAKTRFAATALAKTFRSRGARKIYWAL